MSQGKTSEQLKRILTDVGLIDEVNSSWILLSGIVKQMKKQSYFDRDTGIYRLAMTIYHAKRVSGSSILKSIEDPAAIFLQISAKDLEIGRTLQSEAKKVPTTPMTELVKTFITFLVAAYVYHKVEEELSVPSPTASQ